LESSKQKKTSIFGRLSGGGGVIIFESKNRVENGNETKIQTKIHKKCKEHKISIVDNLPQGEGTVTDIVMIY